MDKAKDSRLGCEDHINNNLEDHKKLKNNWPGIIISTEHGSEDSGHFTASPETDQSGSVYNGSSRGHSPGLVCYNDTSRETPSTSPNSAALVMQACREPKLQRKKPETQNFGADSRNKQMPTPGKGDEDDSYSSGHLRTALNNFNAMYREKLGMIEDIGAQGDAITKHIVAEKKACILESWAKDVCVQNMVLLHTVEELEKQGEEKLVMLKQKIKESSSLVIQHGVIVESYEDRIKTLLTENATSQEDQKILKQDLDKMKCEYIRIRKRISQLEKDNDNLVTLVTRVRDIGVWDVSGLELHKRTFAQIFELYPNLPGSEVQTVFTREKARTIREAEDKVEKLEAEIADLKTLQSESTSVIFHKDSKITELETQVKQLNGRFQSCQVECEHYKKSLIETQEKLLQATTELQVRAKIPSRSNTPNAADSARHAETQELLQELRNVKDQLNNSVKESQSAKEKTSAIRKEFSERLRSMQESQQCLQTEFSHSLETHHHVQEQQIELQKIKDQIQFYQSTHKVAETQLGEKNQTIEELQSTIQQLNNKLSNDRRKIPQELGTIKTTQALQGNTNRPVMQCDRDHRNKSRISGSQQKSCTTFSNSNTNDKPAWNHNFVKSSSLELDSISKKGLVSSTGTNSQGISQRKGSKLGKKEECNKKCGTKTDKSLQNSDLPSNKLFPLCGCASQDFVSLLEGFTIAGERTRPTCVNACLKHMPTLHGVNFDTPSKTDIRKYQSSSVNRQSDLKSPNVGTTIHNQPAEQKPSVSSGNKNSKCYHPQADNPLAHSSKYDILMGVAVAASKQLLNSDSVSKNGLSSIRVTAGHRSRRSHNSRNNSATNQDAGVHSCQIRQQPGFTSAIFAAEVKDFSQDSLLVENINLKANCPPHLSPSLEDILSNLPEQSYMNVVHEWIQKTTGGCGSLNKSQKSHKFQNPLLGKTITKSPKGRSTPVRPGTPKFSNLLSNRKIASKSREIAQEISDIKEEWNRIFSNLDSGSDAEGDCLSKSMAFKEPPQGSSTSTTNIGYQNIIEKLESEKEHLREEYQKELREKDIEITMQKDGLSSGRLSFLELVNGYENLKAEAMTQLQDIKSETRILDVKSHGMEKKIKQFGRLMTIRKPEEIEISFPLQESPSFASCELSSYRKIALHLQQEVKEVVRKCERNSSKLQTIGDKVNDLSNFEDKIRNELGDMDHQDLHLELMSSKDENQRLAEEICSLESEKKKIEEELTASKIELKDLKNTDVSTGYFSPLKRLEQMKHAFDQNEEILLAQKRETEEKDNLITKYDAYCNKLHKNLRDNLELEQKQAKLEEEKNKEIDIRFEKLRKKVTKLAEENLQLKQNLKHCVREVERAEILLTEVVLSTTNESSQGTTANISWDEMSQNPSNKTSLGSGDAVGEHINSYIGEQTGRHRLNGSNRSQRNK